MADPTTPPLRDDEESLEQVVEQETAPKPHAAHKPEHKAGDKEGFLDRAWEAQEKVERKWAGLGSGRFARVLRMARKPEPEEFRQSATIVLVGIGVIGGLGFGVYLLMTWLLKTLHA
jgi:protein transport protein SEC61 subunit gamma-like protein